MPLKVDITLFFPRYYAQSHCQLQNFTQLLRKSLLNDHNFIHKDDILTKKGGLANDYRISHSKSTKLSQYNEQINQSKNHRKPQKYLQYPSVNQNPLNNFITSILNFIFFNTHLTVIFIQFFILMFFFLE